MATIKPRINVTLEPHRYALFKRLAALQGVSMSSLVAELLDAVAEPMERVCVVLEAAKTAPESVRKGLRAAVDRAEAQMMPRALETLDQFDLFLLQSEAATGTQALGHGADSIRAQITAPNPRLVTRGSTPKRDSEKAAGQATTKPKRRAPAKGVSHEKP
ncbi:MAG: hypothetical protein ACTS5I_10915 [Rhodanobacter sp.]